ncbi:helix-turn-helix domain-containing protein [Yinghuangia soli]|uniref:Helix-turn-helix domain-containing protein n=1 Tax=Yinghuangia soli TaxID=2908204 RepID=A0AA41Q5S8_9ACTN|nr:helix-turn-helix domain-containing protein [Yinghuangia soli]MCF2531156.1 helix-turn-helix domain-containing protein [Yinghuangia soli]
MYEEIRKESLKTLLRSCRKGLEPQRMGLPPKQHRRSEGLSQEDAAHLAGVSVRWWSDLENGLQTPHPEMLDAVATALRMSTDQRADLYFLAVGHTTTAISTAPVQAEPQDHELVLRAHPLPAIVTDHVGNVLARNTAAVAYFPDLENSHDTPNITLCLFEPEAAERILNLGELRALRIAHLKAMFLRHGAGPTAVDVIQRVLALPEAALHWKTERATVNHTVFTTHVRTAEGAVEELTWAIAEFTNGKQFLIGFPPRALS